MEEKKVIQELKKEVKKKVSIPDISQIKKQKEFTKVSRSKIRLIINRELSEAELLKVNEALGL